MHFFEKIYFFQMAIWPSGHHRWSKIVPNSPPKCSKHISNPYLVFTSILDHFLKNRKKSIFEIFFRIMHQQNRPNFIFPAENRPNIIGDRKIISVPLQKNFLRIHLVFSGFHHKKYFIDQFGQNPIFDT